MHGSCIQKSLEKRFLGETSSSLGEELSRTGNSSSHGEDASDDREEQWQLASGVKIEYKGNMASITCQKDAVNLFSENVKAKNVEK